MNILFQLFLSFAKVGSVAYGGGPSMIPLVQVEVVDKYHWMSLTDFMDALALGYALPGPIATKMSAVVGYKVGGWSGAIIAVLGIIIPSIIMVLCLFLFLFHFRNDPRVDSLLKGIRPVVLALLALVVYEMFPKAVVSVSTGVIGVIALLVMVFTNLHPALSIICGGVVGVVFFR